MSDQGKANYEAWRKADGWQGSSSEDLEYEQLPANMRHPFDAGADAVEAWVAECPVDEDAPGSEPKPAKVIVVTEVRGGIVAERRYRAASWDRRSDGGLDISREPRSTVDTKWVEGIVGAYHKHGWLSVREKGAEVPDSTAKALEIAKRVLTRLADGDYNPDKPGQAVCEIAGDALNSIWNETEA